MSERLGIAIADVGRVLLAHCGDEVTGAVAIQDLHDGSCEMKPLYVPARFHGQGTCWSAR